LFAAGMFLINYSNVNEYNPNSKSNMDGSGIGFTLSSEQIITENITPKNKKLISDFYVSSTLKNLKNILFFNATCNFVFSKITQDIPIFIRNLSLIN
jgi:hypothetical protein